MVCTVAAWHLAWHNVKNKFGRHVIFFDIYSYLDARKIDTLQVFPLKYFENEPARNNSRRSLVQRGHRWLQLLSGKPTCWMHQGISIPIDETDERYTPTRPVSCHDDFY
jgi:hypothetical protein